MIGNGPLIIPGNFLCDMARDVWRTDSECSIEHAQTKNKPIVGPACAVDKVSPDEIVGRMVATVDIRHHGTDDDRHEKACNYQKASHRLNHW